MTTATLVTVGFSAWEMIRVTDNGLTVQTNVIAVGIDDVVASDGSEIFKVGTFFFDTDEGTTGDVVFNYHLKPNPTTADLTTLLSNLKLKVTLTTVAGVDCEYDIFKSASLASVEFANTKDANNEFVYTTASYTPLNSNKAILVTLPALTASSAENVPFSVKLTFRNSIVYNYDLIGKTFSATLAYGGSGS